MKILITQPEIEQIISAHVLNNFSLKDGSVPAIKFTATRGEDGITAEIDIPYMGVASVDLSTPDKTDVPTNKPSTTAAPARGRKAGTKAADVFPGLVAKTSEPTPAETTTSDTADDASPLGDEPEQAEETEAAGEGAGEAEPEAGEAAAPTPAKSGKSLFD